MSRKDRIVLRLSKGIETYLFKKNKIALFKGEGRLEGAKAVVVKDAARETVPLLPGATKEDAQRAADWKLLINTEVEPEL